MRIVGLIPARGGSKGIPRKNLQTVGHYPLVVRKILQAQETICSEIYVSTEDEEIARVVLDFHGEVITRPFDLATDESSTEGVLEHAIKFLDLGTSDIVVLLQPTSPLLPAYRVDECINSLLANPQLNSVVTIYETHPFIWQNKGKDSWEPINHQRSSRPRRQDLIRSGIETGGCYVFRVSAFETEPNRFPAPSGAIPVNRVESIDIDTREDLNLTNILITSLKLELRQKN